MVLYMLVTFDKYEYSLIVTESLDELAEKCCCSKNAISSAICHSRKNGGKSRFVKVEVDWEGELEMTKIELREGYFIEVDEMNATLKQKYTGKTKEGDEKECEKTIGYYSKPTDAIERFVVLNRTDKMDGMELSISEYVNELKKADKEVLEFLQALKQMGE